MTRLIIGRPAEWPSCSGPITSSRRKRPQPARRAWRVSSFDDASASRLTTVAWLISVWPWLLRSSARSIRSPTRKINRILTDCSPSGNVVDRRCQRPFKHGRLRRGWWSAGTDPEARPEFATYCERQSSVISSRPKSQGTSDDHSTNTRWLQPPPRRLARSTDDRPAPHLESRAVFFSGRLRNSSASEFTQ